jgi:hypothetical protein
VLHLGQPPNRQHRFWGQASGGVTSTAGGRLLFLGLQGILFPQHLKYNKKQGLCQASGGQGELANRSVQ